MIMLAHMVASPMSVSCMMFEVMDKCLSPREIWTSAAAVSAVLLGAGIFKRGLLWTLIPITLVFGPTDAWTDWYSSSLGPDIAHEAGLNYGLHANLGVSLVFAAAVSAWLIATSRLRGETARLSPVTNPYLRRQRLLLFSFVAYCTAFLLLFSYSGFSPTAAIRTSVPMALGYVLTGVTGWLAMLACANRGQRRPAGA